MRAADDDHRYPDWRAEPSRRSPRRRPFSNSQRRASPPVRRREFVEKNRKHVRTNDFDLHAIREVAEPAENARRRRERPLAPAAPQDAAREATEARLAGSPLGTRCDAYAAALASPMTSPDMLRLPFLVYLLDCVKLTRRLCGYSKLTTRSA